MTRQQVELAGVVEPIDQEPCPFRSRPNYITIACDASDHTSLEPGSVTIRYEASVHDSIISMETEATSRRLQGDLGG